MDEWAGVLNFPYSSEQIEPPARHFKSSLSRSTLPNSIQRCRPATGRDRLAAHCAIRLGRLDRYSWLRRARLGLLQRLARDGSGVRVVFPYGFELLLPCWDPGQAGTALSGSLPERVLLNELRRIVRPGDVVVDGGAHVGFYSIAAARLLKGEGRVIAFEADPRNFALLQSNLALNHVEHIVSAEPAALADRESTLEFWTSPEVSTRSSLVYVESQGDTSIRVPCTRLDVHLAQRGITHVDVIKLDVEGAEPMCMDGMQETIRNVGCFVFELNQVRLSEQRIDPLRFVEEVAERGRFSGIFVVDEDAGVLVRWNSGNCTRILDHYGWVNILLRKGSR